MNLLIMVLISGILSGPQAQAAPLSRLADTRPLAIQVILSVNDSGAPTVYPGMPLVIRAELINRSLRASLVAQKRQEKLKSQIQEIVKQGQLKKEEALALEDRLPAALPASPILVDLREAVPWAACFDFWLEPAGEPVQSVFSKIRVIEQPSGAITLDEKNAAGVVWVLDPVSSEALKPGTYQLRSKFDTTQKAAEKAFRGKVDSNIVSLAVQSFPGVPSIGDKILTLAASGEYQLVLKNFVKALEAAEGILKIDPDSVAAYELKGRIFETKGDVNTAAAAYNSAIQSFYKKYPNSYDAPLNLLDKLASLEERRKR